MKARPHEALSCRCRVCREFDGALTVESDDNPAPGWWPDDLDLLPDEERNTEPAGPGEGERNG